MGDDVVETGADTPLAPVTGLVGNAVSGVADTADVVLNQDTASSETGSSTETIADPLVDTLGGLTSDSDTLLDALLGTDTLVSDLVDGGIGSNIDIRTVRGLEGASYLSIRANAHAEARALAHHVTAARGGEGDQGKKHFGPTGRRIKTRLIKVPWQPGHDASQMHEVARVIAAHHQSQADRILRWRCVKLHPDLDKAAVVVRAHAAGHHGMAATVFGGKVQLAG